MTEAEEARLLIYKNALQKMLIKEENEICYYARRCKMSVLESSKGRWKYAINQHKSQYEALDYAIELIKKENEPIKGGRENMARFITLTRRGRQGESLGRIMVSIDSIMDVLEEMERPYGSLKYKEYACVELRGHGFAVRETFNEVVNKIAEAQEGE